MAAFGHNKKALWNHYKKYGFYEGRKAYGTSDSVEAKRKVFDVAESITNDSMTEREKIKAVHDWIINHTRYDIVNYENNTIPEDSYNITGVMLKGVAVCSGYARTFERLWNGGERISYEYFLLSYDVMSQDHTAQEFFKTY